MKIAFISSGNSIHVKKIANALVQRNHSVTLYTLPNHNKLLEDFDRRIQVIRLPISGKVGYYLNVPFLYRSLRKKEYDLINCHYATGYGTLARLTKYHPLAVAVFGSDIFEYPNKSKFNMHQIIKNLDNADVITSTSKTMADEIHKFYHHIKPIYITPFGVDINIFCPQKVKKDDTFEFGTVKKIEPLYGIDILIKAYKEFYDKHKDIKSKLVIYGTGSSVHEYQNLVNTLGLNSVVEFKGFIKNEKVPEAINHMDVACFSSLNESFGVAVVEAMACGIPVIATDVPGFKEVIKDGMTGMIVKRNNVESLADAMDKMYLIGTEKRQKMGNAGMERVKKLYNFSNNIDEYIKALKQAVK